MRRRTVIVAWDHWDRWDRWGGIMDTPTKKKRKPGVPIGNAGEYFVMGELLRRKFDAQLADRNTKGYDLVVGEASDRSLRKVQVKTVRAQPWYVKMASFEDDRLDEVTVYVLLGSVEAKNPIRYFIGRNRDLFDKIKREAGWNHNAFMEMKSVGQYEDKWDTLLT
jgi:hypothetical protein